ncbi:MAG: MmcQ/YjbR family DNA-binding protein [Actinomycetota bacterium]
MVDVDDVRRIALSLPEAWERASYGGQPSWRTPAAMFAWVRRDPEALVVWVESIEEKDAMLAAEPGLFFTTSHYDGHPIVLVSLAAVELERMEELVIESWRNRASDDLVEAWDARAAAAGAGTTDSH